MQKPFVPQAELFVSSSDLEHPALHALDNTEAVWDWSKIEPILSSIYVSKTGPSKLSAFNLVSRVIAWTVVSPI